MVDSILTIIFEPNKINYFLRLSGDKVFLSSQRHRIIHIPVFVVIFCSGLYIYDIDIVDKTHNRQIFYFPSRPLRPFHEYSLIHNSKMLFDGYVVDRWVWPD